MESRPSAAFPQGLENPRWVSHSSTASTAERSIFSDLGLTTDRGTHENEFAARYAAVDVVDGSGEKQSWMSRHGTPPMRGRDYSILLGQPHDSTIVNVAPIHCDTWYPSG